MEENYVASGEAAVATVGADAISHTGGAARRRERAHPGPAEYVKIALVLAVITFVEVAVYYIDALEDALVPILIVLSATKFALVALWFMHLKFDSRLFSALFVLGIILAAAVFIAAWSTLDILL